MQEIPMHYGGQLVGLIIFLATWIFGYRATYVRGDMCSKIIYAEKLICELNYD